MVAGEDDFADQFARVLVVFADVLNEVLHQLQHAFFCPDIAPQVRRRKAIAQFGRRVAGSFVLAFAVSHVERQEESLFALQLRRHVDHERIDGKVGDAATVQEQRFAGISVVLVLLDRIQDILAVERVLQFDGEQWQAVEEQDEIERVLRSFRCSGLGG